VTNRSDIDLDDLRELLARHPPTTEPREHATARFHLGTTLLDVGATGEAVEHLVVAARTFDEQGAATEHARAANMLGVALRESGRLDDAAIAFASAAEVFDRHGDVAECGAALYNLGLVERDRDDPDAALELFAAAAEILDRADALPQAAAARRERGSVLLTQGETAASVDLLTEAVAVARQSGDLAALGYASTLLGLAHLATDRCRAAVNTLRDAVGAHPREIRPGPHSVAKANLALAYERAGEVTRARLVANQTLAGTDVPAHAAEVAAGVLARHPSEAGDLARVLDEEPPETWAGTVRAEVTRWAATEPAAMDAEVEAWIGAVLERPLVQQELLAAWLGALLELPPEVIERVAASTVRALASLPAGAEDAFRRSASRAMARFHVPQLERLRDTFDRAAVGTGGERWV
jgi:tetratricopeptide (TPR) repeat protein